jgi:hypothetical protein
MAGENDGIDAKALGSLKHDIKNQLSSITLVLEELKQEGPNISADYFTYLRMIEASAKTIDELIKKY